MTSRLILPSRVSALSKLNRYLSGPAFSGSKFFIIVDENSYNHCLPTLIAHVPVLGESDFFEVPVGEEAKSVEVVSQLWSALLESGADRGSVIVNFGGGCVSDLGGFVAAGYRRGIRYLNIPTTLVAMADAAIGGKTAVNLDNAKNQVGFFWMPLAVCLHPDFLDTLPESEFVGGLFEVVKTLLISDGVLYNRFVSSCRGGYEEMKHVIGEVILHCASFKMAVVKNDPTELSLRKILNFGHTFGHGIESFAIERGIPLSHGMAVGLGMVCELYLSVRKLGLDESIYAGYREFAAELMGIHRFTLADTEPILCYMRSDKKNRDGQILTVLLQDLAAPVIDVAIDDNEIRDAILHISL